MLRTIFYGLLTMVFMQAAAFGADDIKPPSVISLHGHVYAMHLLENKTFEQQLSGKVTAHHYSGHLVGHRDSWVRLSSIDGSWQGVISLSGQVYLVDVPAPDPTEQSKSEQIAHSRVMSATPAADLPPVACGHPGHNHQNEPESSPALVNPNVHSALQIPQEVQFNELCATTVDDGSGGQICLLAEIEFIFDEAFRDEFGANARGQAEALISMVEGFYRNDFGIIFDTLTLELADNSVFDSDVINSDPLNASDFLNHISSLKRDNNRFTFLQNRNALTHVVTGKDFAGSTAGVAFVDVVCSSFGSGTGTSRLLGFRGPNLASTALVVAHELGHNFGAGHDGQGSNSCDGSSFVMAPSVGFNITEFSSCSKDTIQDRLSDIFQEPRSRRRNDPLSCFNFPADIAIVADAGNPTFATSGADAALQYTVTSADASRDVSQITVTGSVPNSQGRFNTVTLNGQACTVAGDGLSYNCVLNTPPDSMTLITNVQATVASASFTQRVAVSNDDEIVDINSSNDEVVSNLATDSSLSVPAGASNLVASQANVSDVELTWNDNSDNEDNFRIERRENGGNFNVLTTVAANATSFTDTTTQVGVNYGYRVVALNGNGDAVASDTVTIVVSPSVPAVPSNLSASEGNNNSVNLTWTDNSDNETSFRIERRVGNGNFATFSDQPANATRFTDNTTSAGTTYTYRVIARNSGGDSAASNEATITLATPPPVVPVEPDAPSRLSASQDSGTTDVTLSWTDNSSDEDNFRIERRVDNGDFATLATVAANATRYTDNTSAAGTSYSYRVFAVNSAGDSAASNTVDITPTDPAPAAPGDLSATQGSGNDVSLSWTDNSDNEDNFRIERRIGSGSFSTLTTVNAGVTSFTDTNTASDTEYGYRVFAINGSGDSAASNLATVTTPVPPPPAPAPEPDSGGGGSTGWLLIFMGVLAVFRRRLQG
ncbi:fibronectin type III domain-containing protein [Porticoccus sp. GXU_MW_L64]